MIYTATTRLRFVERVLDLDQPRPLRILQQWWAKTLYTGFGQPVYSDEGEWRDVPLEQDLG